MEEILVMEIKVHYWVLVLEFLQRFRVSIRVSGWKRQTFLPFEGVLKGGYRDKPLTFQRISPIALFQVMQCFQTGLRGHGQVCRTTPSLDTSSLEFSL
jgi:hypothetical protein